MDTSMHIIPELDRKGLREFGLVTGAIIAGLFGLFFPWLFETAIPLWPWVVCAVLGAWALIAPQSLGRVYYWWMRFALLLSRITTPIILGIVFYLVVMPVGLIMRLVGHDPMARRLDDGLKSYRVTTEKPSRENMEKPF